MTEFPQFLIDGHNRFKAQKYQPNQNIYEKLAIHGQNPEVLIVGCSDSRVDPITIFGAEPGDLFVVRNVANMVPPYETDGAYHGVSAALEYGVMHLLIKHVIVLGHAGCGGIKAMLDPKAKFRSDMMFISNWVEMMSEECQAVLAEMPDAPLEEKIEALELRSIHASVNNLRSFPFIRAKEESGDLSLHGAYFDVRTGTLFTFNPETNEFRKI